MNLLLLSAFYHSLALVAGVLQTTAPTIDAFREAWLTSALDHGLEKHCHECGRSFAFENDFCPYDGKKLRVLPKP